MMVNNGEWRFNSLRRDGHDPLLGVLVPFSDHLVSGQESHETEMMKP